MLSGILVMLFITIIMIIGFLQIMEVQTPFYSVGKKPEFDRMMNFGKIEN